MQEIFNKHLIRYIDMIRYLVVIDPIILARYVMMIFHIEERTRVYGIKVSQSILIISNQAGALISASVWKREQHSILTSSIFHRVSFVSRWDPVSVRGKISISYFACFTFRIRLISARLAWYLTLLLPLGWIVSATLSTWDERGLRKIEEPLSLYSPHL